ncbi:MAG: hypothetical protein QNJ63_19140 [Calothrix sp. MO_192.B10]|nr:hypothetical protein [Calothrix sp. MO_192.B10]
MIARLTMFCDRTFTIHTAIAYHNPDELFCLTNILSPIFIAAFL